jgi:hypothetical protein
MATKKEKVKQLLEIKSSILEAYVADSIRRGAEEYAPVYEEDKDLFDLLIQSELKTDRAVRKYFKELLERAVKNLNWKYYDKQVKKAGILDYLVKAFWDKEVLVLKIFLTKSLTDAIEAGGLFTEQELKIDVGWSRDSHPAIEYMDKYTLKQARLLTQTTKKRVNAALVESINNGEDRDGAVVRINKTINDKRRATTIAQTESVNAYTGGRLEVGRQVGASKKKVITAGDKKVSAICLDLGAKKAVPIDHIYTTITGEKKSGPAFHPHCRSGLRLYMPGEKTD